jgi:hypothetical protein
MYTTIIQGVPVLADLALPPDDIHKIAMELIQAWAWEGRTLDKIELICDGSWIHACTYKKTSIEMIPRENCICINEE